MEAMPMLKAVINLIFTGATHRIGKLGDSLSILWAFPATSQPIR
jgi:hypothetical protein